MSSTWPRDGGCRTSAYGPGDHFGPARLLRRADRFLQAKLHRSLVRKVISQGENHLHHNHFNVGWQRCERPIVRTIIDAWKSEWKDHSETHACIMSSARICVVMKSRLHVRVSSYDRLSSLYQTEQLLWIRIHIQRWLVTWKWQSTHRCTSLDGEDHAVGFPRGRSVCAGVDRRCVVGLLNLRYRGNTKASSISHSQGCLPWKRHLGWIEYQWKY